MNWSAKRYLLAAIWTMPLLVCLPYAFFVADYKLLLWVWKSGYWPFWTIFLASASVSLLATVALFRLKKIIYWLYVAVAFSAFAQATFLAMGQKKHFLLLIIFFQGACFLAISEWILFVLRRPYFDSRREWWESRPKPIPNASAALYFKEKDETREEVQIANWGEGGCFVFSNSRPFIKKPKEISIMLSNGKSIRSQVRVARFTRDRLGMGLYFLPPENRGDWYKELDDMMEEMRRFGYVSR